MTIARIEHPLPRTIALTCLALLAGCSDPEVDDRSGLDEPVYRVTVVDLDSPGGPAVTESTIAASAQREMIAARAEGRPMARRDLVPDASYWVFDVASCEYSAVWVFDEYDTIGNMLCLRGRGEARLSQFVHHFERRTDWFGTHVVPIGWNGYARSAYAIASARSTFYRDGLTAPVGDVAPYGVTAAAFANFEMYVPVFGAWLPTSADSVVLEPVYTSPPY